MSYVRLNIIDQTQTINDEVHGYFADALVAALTAEPETVEELGAALARFIKPQSEGSPFAGFREGEDFEAYDAGVVVIDLVARVVAADSSSPLTKLARNLKQKNAGVKSSIESLREIGKPESTMSHLMSRCLILVMVTRLRFSAKALKLILSKADSPSTGNLAEQ